MPKPLLPWLRIVTDARSTPEASLEARALLGEGDNKKIQLLQQQVLKWRQIDPATPELCVLSCHVKMIDERLKTINEWRHDVSRFHGLHRPCSLLMFHKIKQGLAGLELAAAKTESMQHMNITEADNYTQLLEATRLRACHTLFRASLV